MPTPVIPAGYSYAQQLTVTGGSATATGSTTTPVAAGSADYTVALHLSGATAAAVFAALVTPPGTAVDSSATADIAVFWYNGSSWVQIDCVVDQATNGLWSTSNILLWFKLQATLAASPATDSNYLLAWGKNGAITAANSWANLYPFRDDFLSWSSGNWGAQPGFTTLSGSILTISALKGSNSNQINSVATYGASYVVAARVLLAVGGAGTNESRTVGWFNTGTSHRYFANTNYTHDASNWDLFYNLGSNVWVPQGAVDSANYRVYHVARDSSGNPYVWRDVDAPAETVSATDTTAMAVSFQAYNAGTVEDYTELVDWVRVRSWMPTEPTVGLTGAVLVGSNTGGTGLPARLHHRR